MLRSRINLVGTSDCCDGDKSARCDTGKRTAHGSVEGGFNEQFNEQFNGRFNAPASRQIV
jgi:hypothetical protein